MKKNLYSILLYSFIIAIIVGCEKENESNPTDQLVFSGYLTHNSTCKSDSKSTSNILNTPDNLSCVEYVFNRGDNKLILKHINAGFNCCPESLYVHTYLAGDTIIIQEYEANALCNCNCLYDLDIALTGIESKKYQIKFIEPYAIDQQEILFEVDLENNSEGEFCVTRTRYPWGE